MLFFWGGSLDLTPLGVLRAKILPISQPGKAGELTQPWRILGWHRELLLLVPVPCQEEVDPWFGRARVLCHSQVSLDATESVIKQMKGQGTSLLCLCLPRAELSAPPQVFRASILHQSHCRQLREGSDGADGAKPTSGGAELSDNFIFCLLLPVMPKKKREKKKGSPSFQSLLPLPCSSLTCAFLLAHVPKRNGPSWSVGKV